MAAFLIYRILFQDGGVEIKQNIPQSANAGSDYTVELTISKGAVSGFAKFQQELPKGMSATAIETNSGTFSFVDQTVKIIWMSLPNDKEFKVSYKVSVSQDVAGPHALSGKFSYIDNNEKKTVNLEASAISIENPNQATAATMPAATENSGTSSTESSSGQTTPTATATGTSGLTCTRNIPVITSSDEFVVEMNIVRGSVSGFAKLEESLPAGFTATAVESNNAVFSFVDQKAKFLWMALPNDSQFKVSYKVKRESGSPSQLTIEGLFSYLENDVTQKVVVPAQIVNLQPGATAQTSSQETARIQSDETSQAQQTETQSTQTQTQSGSQEQNSASNETNVTEPVAQNQPEETQKTTTTEQKTEPVAPVNTTSTGGSVKYRVQILAAHKPVDQSYFSNTHKITDNVSSEMHEGWHKFTIGSYGDYKQARDKRESVSQNNLPGPFVAAYNGGKRITVQEALMISNQKWVK